MSKNRAPSMPTPRQVKDAYEVAQELCPGVRLAGVGPDGVKFEYPKSNYSEWTGKPFGGES